GAARAAGRSKGPRPAPAAAPSPQLSCGSSSPSPSPWSRSLLVTSAGACLLLAQHGLQARDIAPYLAELVGLWLLPGGALHAQRELLLAELHELVGELRHRAGAQLFGVHLSTLPFHERGGHGELRAGEAERFARGDLVHALHLEQHLARLHARHVVLDVALARAHAHLERLLGDRHVREDADPDLAAALH